MKDPLNGLKKAMDQTVFRNFSFSQEQQEEIKNQIGKQRSPSDFTELQQSTGIFLLQSLSLQKGKTGLELLNHLKQTIKSDEFTSQEGYLYVILHRMEQKQVIRSQWVTEHGHRLKRYFIEKKGEKLLQEWERTHDPEVKASLIFQIEGGLT
ncbi:helix-turn-helix transcriptional regulator [Salipaludibacillus sp. CUR1]|uniref:helix-turn-helix transcriptional regulator n=1 Tax=Salipaludibacillus sp. CUR1 TaxID=2820003 RepID=UPI001E5A7B36|nr:helix-turn-helix transcriptional regulator [Salipaludibacillus sp. CUR1]MCE7791535.1 helix-turn-helix transcriptional regulator [Salipaludibacillus sp. CUR1]